VDEFSFIQQLTRNIKRTNDQKNSVFDSDSEIVECGPLTLAINIDEYSGAEDYFKSEPAEILGSNLVIATISDLLAVGATPKYFLHVVTLPADYEDSWLDRLFVGVEKALRSSGAYLLGGDISRGDTWRYVGNAIGTIDKRAYSRKTSSSELALYATGTFGDGNLAALEEKFQPEFESRVALNLKIRDFVSLAMDSSDGFRNTLLTLSQVNSNMRFVANSASAPLHETCLEFARRAGLPNEAFLYGSAGEYELVFGVDLKEREKFERSLKPELEAGVFSLIGEARLSAEPGLFWASPCFAGTRKDIPLSFDPRLVTDRELYVKEIITTVKRLFYS
jgi:thiamine-monophosphate kinase